MLIVIAALSLLGATASRRCSSEPPCSRSPGASAASRTASVPQHDPPMNPKGWRDRS